MHCREITAFDKVWGPPISNEQCFEFLVTDPGKDSRVIDLVCGQSPVQVEKSVVMWKFDAELPAEVTLHQEAKNVVRTSLGVASYKLHIFAYLVTIKMKDGKNRTVRYGV